MRVRVRLDGAAGVRLGACRRELGEQRVERLRVEREVLDDSVGALRAAEIGRDREVGILVLEVDRQLELLRT